ncbi:hypothetical protein FRX31_029291 [Thalictrum thalictroides]|uniref:Uncharacterized protein n=1 Tax=Thalictrum thalictroides TaxID=46969 RepID=A0A7J6V7M5_THATH|nr:hypothetical protein FRX31_029291 [Thalictrum thalictroides]
MCDRVLLPMVAWCDLSYPINSHDATSTAVNWRPSFGGRYLFLAGLEVILSWLVGRCLLDRHGTRPLSLGRKAAVSWQLLGQSSNT